MDLNETSRSVDFDLMLNVIKEAPLVPIKGFKFPSKGGSRIVDVCVGVWVCGCVGALIVQVLHTFTIKKKFTANCVSSSTA